ncbi:MAG: hypothetical protein IKQ60_01125 [Candidatus Methanomethylophilaceae archaeon]|nr:hypothetical protein [Candidatus Methanomethylophilaceae archaeon]
MLPSSSEECTETAPMPSLAATAMTDLTRRSTVSSGASSDTCRLSILHSAPFL